MKRNLLLFALVVIIGVVTSLTYLNKDKLFSLVPVVTISPVPVATQTPKPELTPTATVTLLPKKTITPPLYDGSRTGEMIDYKERCTGKTIKIYSNEQMRYRDSSGKEYLLTLGDIRCLVLEDCRKTMIITKASCASTDYDCQIAGIQKAIDGANGAFTNFYNWRIALCGSDLKCRENAGNERKELDNQCITEFKPKY